MSLFGRNTIWILTVCFLIGGSAYAVPSAAPHCKATEWPFSRKQSRSDLFKMFKALGRPALLEYYFSEVTAPKKPSLAEPLSLYLKQTEPNEDLRDFFSLIEEGAGLKRKNSYPKALKINEICDVYIRVITSSFGDK